MIFDNIDKNLLSGTTAVVALVCMEQGILLLCKNYINKTYGLSFFKLKIFINPYF